MQQQKRKLPERR